MQQTAFAASVVEFFRIRAEKAVEEYEMIKKQAESIKTSSAN